MSLSTFVFTILSIVLTLFYFIRRKFSYWKNLNIPYIEPKFPQGNLKGVGKDDHLKERLEKFYNEYKHKSPIVGMYFYIKPVALILDQNLIKNILISDSGIFNDRSIYYNEKDDPLSAHLFTIHGTKWRLLRSKLTPTFTSGKMKFMFPTLVEVMKRLENKLLLDSKQDENVEVKDIYGRYTTDIIGSCAFGIECNTLHDQNSDFRKMGKKIFNNSSFNAARILFLMSFRDLARKLHMKILDPTVSKFYTDVLVETINYRKENQVRRNDFLDILIELKKNTELTENPLTLNEILAQAFLFFGAGFETSSTLLTFCLYELAVNQDIQDKTRQHIEEVLARHNGELTYEAMMEMKYLDQVLNETLRLHGPAGFLFRTAEIDYKVPNTNYVLQKGTQVVVPTHAIHKDPDFYPNPNKFDPENFNDLNLSSRPSTTFLSFGEGPRSCIGNRFALMQSRLGIIGTLRKFKFCLSPKMDYPVKLDKSKIFTSPIGGMWLKIREI